MGCHAYSVLDVRELRGVAVGEQKRITDFFAGGTPGPPPRAPSPWDPPPGVAEGGVVRLVQIRNPWGRREWRGAFSSGAAEWTPRLRALLGQDDRDNGTFWMTWHDVLARFVALDVCKTHRGWFAATVLQGEGRGGGLPPGGWAPGQWVELRVEGPTWLYASICQPNKRGKARRRYYYSDISLLVARTRENGSGTRLFFRRSWARGGGTRRKRREMWEGTRELEGSVGR